ncbi:Uncharacterised protein [Bordetella pertussis]|nr:Uncharacterised protein [Bordetella pertussis]CPL09514.1 Uncharacterised protein [Bordetella pertussis]CPM43075.1 Uncharacterised protein [Bordetella pertussis]
MNTNSGTEISESLVMVAYVRCTIRSSVWRTARAPSSCCMK